MIIQPKHIPSRFLTSVLIRYLTLHNNHYLSRKTLMSRLREENRRRDGRGFRANLPPRKGRNEERDKERGRKEGPYPHLNPPISTSTAKVYGANAKETPIDVSRETLKISLYVVLAHSFASWRMRVMSSFTYDRFFVFFSQPKTLSAIHPSPLMSKLDRTVP